MRWELEYADKAVQVEAAERKGRALPQWYLDVPDEVDGDGWYLDAFERLSTTRSLGMGPGPVPWSAIVDYADRAALDAAMSRAFVEIIMAMDRAWLEWHAERAERERARA